MKCTVNAGEFSAALRGPCDRTKPHTIIPILKCVRVEAAGAKLMLLGHDLDSSSEATLDSEVAAPGACAIPTEPLARLIAGLPKAASVLIEVVGTDAIIKSGRSRYKLPILPADDMPAPLSAEGGFKFIASSDQLDQLLQRGRPALNLRDERSVCHGMHLHKEKGKLSSSATSGYMLMRFSTEIDADEFKGAIIPRTSADEILKMGEGEVTISDRIISITSGRCVYSSKIIEAIYPDIVRIIPDLVSSKISIDREYAIECLSRLNSIGTFIESDLIDVSVGADEISISMTGTADGAETIECESSEAAFICLKASQLIDALKTFRGENVDLYIKGTSFPFRIVDPSEPDAINVLMPCKSRAVEAKAA